MSMEIQYCIRSNAGRWYLLKRDERGEWVPIKVLDESSAQRLVHALEG